MLKQNTEHLSDPIHPDEPLMAKIADPDQAAHLHPRQNSPCKDHLVPWKVCVIERDDDKQC